ncbi:MAG: TolB family protein, partial [Actinomycetota bacterium]
MVGSGDAEPPVRLTGGAWSDQAPAWSPDGSRLAFLSDRATPGHQQPYTMSADGGEPELAGALTGSAESVAWSSDGSRLLVLAADPGSYGLDWSARAVTGAGAAPDPVVRRPGDARRRLFLVEPASSEATEVGPPDLSVWEFDWDGDAVLVAIVSRDHSGSGWYKGVIARLDLGSRTARTLYEPSWQTEGLAISPDASRAIVVEGYASDHGLLSGSIMLIDLETGATTDPWPDLQTVGRAVWCGDGSLWYARTDGTGNACGRIWLDGRREERWRDDAFIGDAVTTPSCVITSDAANVWTTHQAHGRAPELARFDHDAGAWSRLTGFNDAIVAGRVFPDVRTIRWAGEDGVEI